MKKISFNNFLKFSLLIGFFFFYSFSFSETLIKSHGISSFGNLKYSNNCCVEVYKFMLITLNEEFL